MIVFGIGTNASAATNSSLEIKGIKYTESSGKYIATNVAKPEEVTMIELRDKLGSLPVDYTTSFDITKYTNLKDVIVPDNSPEYAVNVLKNMKTEFDLYLGGQWIFAEGFNELKIKDLYLCTPYQFNTEAAYDVENISHLNGSSVDNIYIAPICNSINMFVTNDLEMYMTITNDAEKTVTPTMVGNSDFKYDVSDFVPYTGFSYTTPFLGANGYTILTDLTNSDTLRNLATYRIKSVNAKVQSLYIEDFSKLSPNSMMTVPTLVIENYTNNSLSNITGTNLIIKNLSDTVATINIGNFKNIRFYPAGETKDTLISSITINTTKVEEIDKIYIPAKYAETCYAEFYNETDLMDKVETYDSDQYSFPNMSSFISEDGNTYFVKDQTISLDTLEAGIAEIREAELTPLTTRAIDEQIASFKKGEDLSGTETGDEVTGGEVIDEETPVISTDISGFKAATSITYYGDYTYEEVFKMASNYLLWNEGLTADTTKLNVEINVTEKDGSFTIKISDSVKTIAESKGKITKLEESTVGEFIFVKHPAIGYGTILVDVNEESKHNLKEVYTYVMSNEMSAASITASSDITKIDFKTETEGLITSSYRHTNEETYDSTIEYQVLDIDKLIETSKAEIEVEKENFFDKTKDKLTDWFEDFKTKFEENKAVKAATIAFGCITGILLIYGIYVIFKKLFKWLGR